VNVFYQGRGFFFQGSDLERAAWDAGFQREGSDNDKGLYKSSHFINTRVLKATKQAVLQGENFIFICKSRKFLDDTKNPA